MDIVQIIFIFQERVEIDSPESFRCRAKSSGSPPMNSPVFSPIIVLPLEAEELPGIVERESKFERMRILESFEGQTERKKLFFFFLRESNAVKVSPIAQSMNILSYHMVFVDT